MKTVVLKTDKFPHDPEGDLKYCNGQPGSAFARWLKDELARMRVAGDELIQEDYGWGFWILSDEAKIWICVSFGDLEDDGKARWYISVSFEEPFLLLRPWMWGKKKSSQSEEEKIFGYVENIVSRESAFEVISKDD